MEFVIILVVEGELGTNNYMDIVTVVPHFKGLGFVKSYKIPN